MKQAKHKCEAKLTIKSILKIFVVVIPKEGLAGPPKEGLAGPRPSFGISTTKILKDVLTRPVEIFSSSLSHSTIKNTSCFLPKQASRSLLPSYRKQPCLAAAQPSHVLVWHRLWNHILLPSQITFYSQCYTKRRLGGALPQNPSFGMTTTKI